MGRTTVAGGKRGMTGPTIPVDPVLGNNSPAQIQKAAQQGIASSLWAVGDTVPITLNGTVGIVTFSNETYYAFILGFDHNPTYEGTNTIHFGFAKTSTGVDVAFCDSEYNTAGTGAAFRINTTSGNSGGWNGSYMRNTICPAFLNALPAEWQGVIKACTKYSDNTGGGNDTASYVTKTEDKIWLLAEFEVFGSRTYANSAEQNYQAQYDYYKNGNSKIKYRHDATSTTCDWWLRSAQATISSPFCVVYIGVAEYGGTINSSGFAPGFMVA